MCEEWWFRRRAEEAEASRRMWEEFERTRPLSDPEVTEEEPPVTPREARADAARGQGLSVREIGGLRVVLGARRLSGGGPRSSLWRRPPPHRPQNDERSGGVPGRGDHSRPCLCGVGRVRYPLMQSRSNARPPGSAAAPWRPCASPLSPQLMPRRPRCSSASTIQRWLSICSRRSRIGTAACDSPLSRTARPRS